MTSWTNGISFISIVYFNMATSIHMCRFYSNLFYDVTVKVYWFYLFISMHVRLQIFTIFMKKNNNSNYYQGLRAQRASGLLNLQAHRGIKTHRVPTILQPDVIEKVEQLLTTFI